jgi:exodeoxyribonuclease V alpha subunit
MTTTRLEGDLGAELAALLAARAQQDGGLVRDTVQALWQQRQDGHVCTHLGDLRPVADEHAFPPVDEFAARLLASGVCQPSTGAPAPLPLVLDTARRLYFLRHFRDEQVLLTAIRHRLAAPWGVPPAALRAAFAALGMAPEGDVDWQLAAVAAAAAQPFVVITGGPGTGKTTTVARLLAVLLQLEPTLRVALAAPTGKAAARLAEALQARANDLPVLTAARDSISNLTLHRLLGYQPLDDTFRHGPDLPLVHDVVVVDEVSMADPALLARLLLALRPDARLVLVGDRDQLAAVAAGQVLGDLCRAARPERGVGRRLAEHVLAATGMVLPVQAAAPPIANAVVALRRNHRFASQPGIGAFAAALAQRDPTAALAACDGRHGDLVHEPDAERALALVADALSATATAARTDAAAALAALLRCRVLTAVRHGPMGAAAWNRRVEAELRRRGHAVDEPFYVGRPVLVTTNDHQNRIWNGDLGIVVATAEGHRAVAMPAVGAGGVRLVPLLRLPPHETAWAMTVHKAQGSEFDEVLLAMPTTAGPLWQAPLVYTGVTRARRRAVLCAPAELLAIGLARWPQRGSGLADGVGEAANDVRS